jgi:hypothetical protein
MQQGIIFPLGNFYIYNIYNMTIKIRKKVHNKTLKKFQKMQEIDTTDVWGKNKPLEKFWRGLASGKYVVVVYKNGKSKYIKPPNPSTQKLNNFYNELDANEEIEAVLSSNLSQDAYEIYLYPKAKNNSVDYVIKNYKKYFKSMGPLPKDLIKKGKPLMEKVKVPS